MPRLFKPLFIKTGSEVFLRYHKKVHTLISSNTQYQPKSRSLQNVQLAMMMMEDLMLRVRGYIKKAAALEKKGNQIMMMLMMIDWKKILFEGESNPRPMSEAEAVQRLFKLDPLSYLWWWWLTKNLCQRCTYLHHKTNHWWWWWWERFLKGYKRAPRRRVDHNGSGKMSREKVSFYLFSLLLWWNNGQVLVKRYRCSSVWWNHAHQKGQCKIIVCNILLRSMFKYLNDIYMQCIAFYW